MPIASKHFRATLLLQVCLNTCGLAAEPSWDQVCGAGTSLKLDLQAGSVQVEEQTTLHWACGMFIFSAPKPHQLPISPSNPPSK